ncbi:outer dynein arm-docking complex subunit 4-like [Leptopilina heterotoma]|uniref:outer dynein arm-docking complex subunit 4-like n=1 Tax=Leptopilina heterotoma TaxID=63436 RepID=UPI001CA89525|nr:outer dynein arm-docking complex subunit 4-like [Leptopilina heterotoma]
MKHVEEEEEPELFRGAALYREWGCRFTTLKQFVKAIEYFIKSMELSDGNDLKTLLGLTSALTSIHKYKAAAKIVDMCMKTDPNNYKVIWARIETLYKITEFEESLIYAYQGRRLRPFPFKWGIYQANETIEDCVGNNTSSIVLKELYPWIKEMEHFFKQLNAQGDQIKDEFEGIDENKSKFKVNDTTLKKEAYLRKHQSFVAEIYLRSLAKDKHFVEEILQRAEIWSANKESSRELENLAKLCFTRLHNRQEMLRVRRPLLAERIKTLLDNNSQKKLPIKNECLEKLYNIIALTYIQSRDLSKIKDEEMKKIYLKHHIGIKVGKLPRDEDIGWVPTAKKKKALQEIKNRLAMTNNFLELAWIFHDFSKLLMEKNSYEWARHYARKSRDNSLEINNEFWFINATHLLLRIEIHQNNITEAMDAALMALSCARKLKEENRKTFSFFDYLVDFYQGIIEILNETDVEKMAFVDNIAIREQLIVDLMPIELKPKMDYILRRMRVIPSNRRFSIMPGCKPIDNKLNLTFSMINNKKNTIFNNSNSGGAPRDHEKEMRKTFLQFYTPSKKIPGLLDFDDYI